MSSHRSIGMMMDIFAMVVGYSVMGTLAVMAVSGLVIYAVGLVNRAMWRLFEPYGGLKAFNQFRKWYWSQPENQRTNQRKP